MKVILLEDVKNVGKKNEVVEVSDAFARNMIIKKKRGVEANSQTLNDLKLRNKRAEKDAAENLAAAQQLAEDLKEKQVEVTIKAGTGGRTFGSVSTKEIAEAVKTQLHLELDKKKMQLTDPIKALGFYDVPVKLHPQVTANLRVHVVEG
ncbi:MAG: 50S ribosomal protein L9 [Eubacterium sp.]|jgi:large subunit ribosomal protein L9|nr:50S ribosomal protein L9 [Eubacterium sp.]